MESQRLFFKEIELSDSEFIVGLRENPQVYKFFLNPHRITIQEHINWFRNNYLNNPDRIDYICFEKATNERIGVFGLLYRNDTVEVNYLLAQNAQGRGFATEAVECLISFSVKKWNVKNAIAEIHKDNFSSINLAKRLGFILKNTENSICVYEKTL